ncbi:CLIP domain-containing serine protease C9-like [Anopheles marshallii]|uniref:CLIP domain-containing serine protease C9-like n=1 Tax=Anopheles marshallii TaxID=1521116 RepID=UPI00237B6FF0|nr:CLIP domain-containing serine protease C9-like [Anopheles marshallii]
MVEMRVIVLIQILWICNTFGFVRYIINVPIKEGEVCQTEFLDGGKCMNVELCDSAFIHSLSYEDHSSACQQNAFYNVFCCQPFLDFCKHRKKPHIAHGTEAEPGTFPHLARLGVKSDDGEIEWRCSANIISVKFLLTAAHCKAAAALAGVGCTGAAACEQQITVKDFISHLNYNPTKKYHDIAVVKLHKNIEFNVRVLPICPYANKNDIPDTEDMIIAGWGTTENLSNAKSLMYATVRTVPIKKCRDNYMEVAAILGKRLSDGVLAEQYCARGSLVEPVNEYSDACQGDSGGPLQVKQGNDIYLVGVISVGIGCASALPGLYARVAAYFDWINATITGSP